MSYVWQAVQVFDSWAGVLSPRDFNTWCLPFLKEIASGVKAQLGAESVPMILFAKGVAGHALPLLAGTDYDVLALDWTVSPAQARQTVDAHLPKGKKMALQGNLDPSVLYASPASIRQQVEQMLRPERGGFAPGYGHIANLGHGITPGVDPEHLRHFLRAIHEIGTEVAKQGSR